MPPRASFFALPCGGLGLLALAMLCGCHTGLEVAGVKSAYASREPDGRVKITATLQCQLVQGRGRSEGCDADDSNVCLQAKWYDTADEQRTNVRYEARSCAHQKSIEGAQMVVVSEVAIPRSAPVDRQDLSLKIWVQTDTQDPRRYAPQVMYSP